MQQLSLVEYHISGQLYPEGLVVALTPQACYKLGQEGIAYKIPEDFYDWVTQSHDEKKYNLKQLAWIRRIDDWLWTREPQLKDQKFRPVTIYKFFLKHSVDVIVFHAGLLTSIINASKVEKIVLFGISDTEPLLDWQLRCFDEAILGKLLPIFAHKEGVDFEFRKTKTQDIISKVQGVEKRRIFRQLAQLLIISLKTALDTGLHVIRRGRQSKTFFLLKRSWGLNTFARQAYRAGDKIVFAQEDEVKLSAEELQKTKAHWRQIYAALANKEIIWSEINSLAGLDVSSLVIPIVKYFFEEICPELLLYHQAYRQYFRKAKIDFVMAPHRWELPEFAAFNAATVSESTTSVLVTHGYSAFETGLALFSESGANQYITVDAELEDHFKHYLSLGIDQPSIVKKADIWRSEPSTRSAKINSARQQVLFAPAFFDNMQRRRVDGCHYPLCWYWQLHVQLIKYFMQNKRYDFIYKARTREEGDFLEQVIENLGAQNIRFSRQVMSQEILHADRFITDYPSTAMIEALAAYLPTLALHHKGLSIRKTAQEKFPTILQPFSTFDDLKVIIEQFLQSDGQANLFNTQAEKLPILRQVLQESKNGLN